jgi:hypothetical protein
MTEQKQFCEEHNSLARHAELVSASPKRPCTSYDFEHISEPFWEMPKQVRHDDTQSLRRITVISCLFFDTNISYFIINNSYFLFPISYF